MSEGDPFEEVVFLEEKYFARGKAEGIRYVIPSSWFQGLLTGLEESFTFVAYVERHKIAAQLTIQLEPLLSAWSFK
jgi:hypothetical protein